MGEDGLLSSGNVLRRRSTIAELPSRVNGNSENGRKRRMARAIAVICEILSHYFLREKVSYWVVFAGDLVRTVQHLP
jgi:hypothetical protein